MSTSNFVLVSLKSRFEKENSLQLSPGITTMIAIWEQVYSHCAEQNISNDKVFIVFF